MAAPVDPTELGGASEDERRYGSRGLRAMGRMTHDGNGPDGSRLAMVVAGDGDAPRPAVLTALALLLGTVTALVGVDVADDARSGGSRGHIALELLIMAAAL